MTRIFKLLPVIIIIFSFPILAGPALAQDPEPNYDRINDIAEDLNCPTCTGINLADCRTLTCAQWKEKISDLVTDGYSDEEVLDYFSTRYGTQVLQEPPRSGFTLILWVLPVIAILAGGAWLAYVIRGWRKDEPAPVAVGSSPAETAKPAPAGTDSPPDDYLSQVEKDLGLE
jgi:cytochrome c-type biogenesis protein CcmH